MKQALICLLIGTIALVVYWGSLPGAFHFDDLPLLLDSPRVSSPAFDYGAFAEMYGGRPLTLWVFHLEYRLFGRDPLAFHVVNVFLHLLAAVLLYLWIRRWQASAALAFIAALIFIVHPAQAQVVDYVWARSLELMAVFGFGALLLVRRHPWWALLVLQLAVWSRAEALVFLVPLILLDRRLLRPALALGAVDLAAFVYGYMLASPAEFGWNHPGWWSFWLQAPGRLLHYLGWLIWPNAFSVYHDAASASLLHQAIAVFVLAGLALWTRIARHRLDAVWIGLAWTVLFLLPSVLIPNSEPFSESRVYVALAGMAVAAACGIRVAAESLGTRLRGTGRRRIAEGFLVAVLVVPSVVVTQERHRVWADDVALWREAVRSEPDAVLPNYNLAVALSNRDRTEEACRFFRRSVHLNPRDDMSYSGLGYCAEVSGQIHRAAGYYSRALSLNTDNEYAREALDRLGLSPASGEGRP